MPPLLPVPIHADFPQEHSILYSPLKRGVSCPSLLPPDEEVLRETNDLHFH